MSTRLHAPMFLAPQHSGFCVILTANHAQLNLLHSHDFHEIILVKAGQAEHITKDSLTPVKKGDLIFLFSENEHCFSKNVSSEFTFYNLIIRKDLLDDLLDFFGNDVNETIFENKSNPIHRGLNLDQFNQLNHTMNKLATYPKLNAERYNSAIKLCFAEILTILFFKDTPITDKSIPEWINKLVIQIHEPAHYRKGVTAMQELANCSKEHLSRTFQKYFKLSPTDYINEIRLEEAAVRIIYSSDAIIEIAEEVGFNNLSHFYHLFKKKFHTTPKQYRDISRLSSY